MLLCLTMTKQGLLFYGSATNLIVNERDTGGRIPTLLTAPPDRLVTLIFHLDHSSSNSATMASSHLPVVPPEIWKTVLENCNSMKDLIHLWTQCRQVSTQFKADVESAFIKQHLPVLSLLFDVKSLRQEHFKDETHVDPKYHIHQVYNVYTTSYFPDTRYIGLSKERKTALFSARTEEELAAWTNPPMTLSSCTNVQLREHSHCVEVRCRYELRKGEVVFELDWKEMLEQLLQEGAAALGNWRPRSKHLIPSHHFRQENPQGFDKGIIALTLHKRPSQPNQGFRACGPSDNAVFAIAVHVKR